jgi:hypothetical protein
MPEPTKTANPFGSVAGILGAVGGWALSQYSGANLWIPAISAFVLLIVFAKTRVKPERFVGAIAATGGHIVWFVAGGILTGQWSPVALDIALLAAGATWLWMRPALAAAVFLGVVQLGSLMWNTVTFISAEVGSAQHRALTVHCLLRVLALAGITAGLVQIRRERTVAASITPTASHVAGPDG